MSMCEIHDAYLAEGTVNGDIFDNIVDKCLLPCLMPFNGINPRSVVVMDNASIHHVDKIRDLIEQKAKAILCFLPPYSPDLMLAEGVFRVFLSKMTHYFKQAPRVLLMMGFGQITPEDCYRHVLRCGYI